jgi:hypothetical protein
MPIAAKRLFIQRFPKKIIKVNYCDYVGRHFMYDPGVVASRFIPDGYGFALSDEPDFLFCFNFGVEFMRRHNCVKIFFYEENIVPDFNYYDYAIGMQDLSFGGRHLYIPYYASFLSLPPQDRSNLSPSLANRKFCNFIYNNAARGRGAAIRQDFCKKLMRYKHVDCPGAVLNNMKGGINDRWSSDWESGKIEFLKNYKFSIAFENSSQIGYTTEKLYFAFMANSVPIYWGNPDVAHDFNPKAFVNCNDYGNDFDAVIRRVAELDADDGLYMGMLRENPLKGPCCENFDEKIKQFLAGVFERGNEPFCKDEVGYSVAPQYIAEYRANAGLKPRLYCAFKHCLYKLLSKICPNKGFDAKIDKYKKRLDLIKFFRKGV